MIRGVNKNVIEISDTGNDCFERAILFVRPDSVHREEDILQRRAHNYLSGLKLRPWFYPRKRRWLFLLGWISAAFAGAAITAAILLI